MAAKDVRFGENVRNKMVNVVQGSRGTCTVMPDADAQAYAANHRLIWA